MRFRSNVEIYGKLLGDVSMGVQSRKRMIKNRNFPFFMVFLLSQMVSNLASQLH